MGGDEVILSIAEAVLAKNAVASAMLGEATHIINGVWLYFAARELDGKGKESGDEWGLDWTEAEDNAEAEMAEQRFAAVRYRMDYGQHASGEIGQTTITAAKTLEKYGIALRVSDAEAEAYGHKARLASGGWMDDPAWRQFTGNYNRVRFAEALKRRAA